MDKLSQEPRWRMALALSLPFEALAVQWVFWPWVKPFVWFLFFPAVFFAARLGGRKAGVLSAIESCALVIFFFVAPQVSWRVADPMSMWTVLPFIGMGYFVGDVHERLDAALLRAEADRSETEAKYEAIVEQSLAGIYVLQGGIFKYVNPRMAEMLGYDDPAEIIDIVRVVDVVAPEEREGLRRRLGEAASGEIDEANVQLKCIRKDGRRVVLEFHGHTFEHAGQPAIIGATLDVTDKVESLRLLKRREELLSRTSEMAKVGGWEVDARTMEESWSDEVARIHGLPVGTKPSDEQNLPFYTDDSHKIIERAFSAALKSGTPFDLELEIVAPEGSRRWVRTTGEPVYEAGEIVRLEGTLQEITERKAAEKALAASERRYRTLFESLVEGVAYCEMIFDDKGDPVDWIYLDVNRSFPRITGLEDMQDKHVLDVLPGIRESNPELFEIYGTVAKTGVPFAFEAYVPVLHRGQWLEVSVTCPSKGRFVAAFADITERKNAETALRESEQRYRELVEQTPDGIFLADSDGRYIDVNPAGAELLGYSPDEIKHVLLTDVLEESEFPRLGPAIEEMSTGATMRSEWCFKRKDRSTFTGELVGRMLPDGKLQGILRDVTERKQAEQAVRNLNVTLERRVEQRTAEVVAANTELEAFAYAVSHDLRAPLRAMSGFSQALIEDCNEELDDQGRDYLQHIISASRNMSELIDALLSLSRATRGEMVREPVDVSALASSLLDEHRLAAPERDVESTVEPGLSTLGDPRMIDSLLRNLIGNAWKYSSNKEHAVINVSSCDIDGASWICVTDNGAGFNPDYADQLFKPFRRLHRQDEFNGIGVGLATVQRIVARHGGEIRAEGKVAEGARFCFRLPEAAGNSPDEPAAAPVEPTP